MLSSTPKTCYQAPAKMSTARKHFTKHQKKDIAKHTRTCSQAPENMLACRYFSGPGPGPGSGPRLGAGDREPEAGAKAGASSEWRPFSTNCQFLFIVLGRLPPPRTPRKHCRFVSFCSLFVPGRLTPPRTLRKKCMFVCLFVCLFVPREAPALQTHRKNCTVPVLWLSRYFPVNS